MHVIKVYHSMDHPSAARNLWDRCFESERIPSPATNFSTEKAAGSYFWSIVPFRLDFVSVIKITVASHVKG